MDEDKEIKPGVFTPTKKVDEKGYDEDGTLHDKWGTDECCKICDTAEEE